MRVVVALCVSALAMIGAATCAADEVFPVVHNEPLTVRILDGKTGYPHPGTHVILTGGYRARDVALGMWQEEDVTDAEGRVQVSDALKNLPLLRIQVLKARACGPDANASWSVERIRLTGLSSANRCGSAPAIETPGVFTLSVVGRKRKAIMASIASPAKATESAESAVAHGKPQPQPPLSDAEIDQLLAEQP